MYLDNAFLGFLGNHGFANKENPSRFVPAAAVRLGYNFSNHWGFSVGAAGGRDVKFLNDDGVRYLTPFAAITYTANINARFSPFITGGTQFTRVTNGQGRVTHPTWGAHAGLGVRSMLSPNVALRLEGRMAAEHYAELPGSKTAYNSILTLGLSYFTGGHKQCSCAPAAPPRTVERVRVDTLWRTRPAPPPPAPVVIRDTLVLEGVNFEFDSAVLTPVSKEILNRVASSLSRSEYSVTRWEVAGHTSRVGSDAWNQSLSQRRAVAVRVYLVSRGVSDSRLVAKGYGESNPKYPESADGDDPRNRRVELRRTP
jgi:outer membrane protein OmpA-like peptidoglycan-associated protein